VQAKDYADSVSQWLIEDLSCVYLASEAKLIVAREQISHIIVAPLRRERVVRGGWHPSFLLEKACALSGAKIIVPTIRGVERQAVFSAIAREKRVAKQSPQLLYPHISNLCQENVTGVLFVDDVITTGGSAQRARQIMPENFQKVPWHILSIFRSPRKSE
jgi:predicted amidophosphoribosyltransferase